MVMNIIKYFTDALKYELNVDFFEFPSFDLIDLIDIFIVAFLIYQLLSWIKDTRAWTLFKGIMFILIMSLVAQLLQLNTILWIFEKTINVGILAVIIVFQPELRKALEQLGRGNFISSIIEDTKDKNNKISVQSVEAIITALKQMAKVKTGAIMAIEHNVKLGEHERTGISIDAKISSQILINIFEHNTPLHDGAVIIRNDRIAAATCFLPITDNPDISLELGSRHRAALGLSEVSDAKIFVVSEETGTISMAYGGHLVRNISEDHIRKQLIHAPKKKKKEGRKFTIWKGRKHE